MRKPNTWIFYGETLQILILNIARIKSALSLHQDSVQEILLITTYLENATQKDETFLSFRAFRSLRCFCVPIELIYISAEPFRDLNLGEK